MKKTIRKYLLVLAAVFAAEGSFLLQDSLTVLAQEVSVSSQTLEMAWGRTNQVTAYIDGAEASDDIVWTTSDPETATVDEDGVITGIKRGTAAVRAASKTDENVYAEVEVTVREVRVSCVGDSLTAGYLSSNANTKSYPARLQTLLGDDYLVTNFGRSSTTLLTETDWSYTNQSQYTASLQSDPDVVIIMLGTNDSKAKYWDNGGKERFEQDAVNLVQTYQNLDSKPEVIYATSPTVFESGGADIRGTVLSSEIVPIQRKLAEEYGWKTIDMHELTADKQSLYNADGIHFSDIGYYYEAECMYSAITGKPYVEQGLEVASITGGTEETSVEGQNSLSYAIDGDYSTIWHSAWTPAAAARDLHWVVLELKEKSLVNRVDYLPRQSGTNGIITEYEILVSQDGGETYTSVDKGNWGSDSQWKKAEFEPIAATHVKLISISSLSSTGGDLSSAAEIWVNGTEYIPEEVVKAKEELSGTILEAEQLDSGIYTEESLQAVREALEAAKSVIEKDSKDQEEIDTALEALKKALEGLAKKPETDDGKNQETEKETETEQNTQIEQDTQRSEKIAAPKKLSLKKKKAAKKSKRGIQIKWKKVKGAVCYRVARKTGAKGKYRVIATVKKGKVLYLDKKVKAGKKYYYKVCAGKKTADGIRYGSWSAEKSRKY